MKKLLLILLLAIIPASANASNKYIIDKNHANITWFVSHNGFSSVSGTFTKISGTIFFNKDMVSQSNVRVKIQTNSLQTAVPRLTAHLKGPDFFNTDMYPDITFISTSVEQTGKNTAIIEGELTMNSKMRTVKLKATFNKEGLSTSKKRTVGFSAEGKIKRSDFDLKYGLPEIGDDVKILIEVEAIHEEDGFMDMP